MKSDGLPVKIYTPFLSSGRTWTEEPNSRDDVLYVRRDALLDKTEYKSLSPAKESYVERPVFKGVDTENGDLFTRMRFIFSDHEYKHTIMRYAHRSDVANELRYFAGKLMQ